SPYESFWAARSACTSPTSLVRPPRDVAFMQGFSSSFLIFFYQIALGGLFALAGTPFHEIERAFYKSTAGVLYVIALLQLWGESSLLMEGTMQGPVWGNRLELIFHLFFVLA